MIGLMNQQGASTPEMAIDYYFEGTEKANIDLLKKGFHPDCKIYYVDENRDLQYYTQSQFHQLVLENHGKLNRKNTILSIDVSNNIASAKTRSDFDTFYFIDYLTLAEVRGSWLIIAKSTTRFTKDEASKESPASIEATITAAEMNYWEKLKALDMPAYKDLLHNDFSDWPWIKESALGSVGEMTELVSKAFKDAQIEEYQLSPIKVFSSGEVAAAYYTISLSTTVSGQPSLQTFRMIHIWKKEGAAWKLLAGMQGIIE